MNQIYDTLNQTHPSYSLQDIQKKRLLYCGGDDIIRNAKLFIPQMIGERQKPYMERLQCASYVNYMATIIDYFASNLFSKELAVMESDESQDEAGKKDPQKSPSPIKNKPKQPKEDFYKVFAADADLTGNSFPQVLKQVFKQAMISGTGFLGLDFPKPELMPASLAEEESMGVDRCYTYEIEEESVINWELDDLGNFKWVVLKKECPVQLSPFSPRDKKSISFKVWERDGETVTYKLFEIICKIDQQPMGKEEVPLIDHGTTSFKQIPILRLHPSKGLFIGNKVGTLVADHFRMRSTLLHAQNKSLYAMPYYKQGAELDGGMDGPLSVINEDTSRGMKAANTFANRGFQVIGPTDELGFVEPTGACYELINTELKEMQDEIFRTVSQMAQSVSVMSGGAAKSAASKMADNHALEMTLSEFGAIMRQFATQAYNCMSDARNEKIVWQAHGLSNYEILDREQLIAEAMAFQEKMIVVPSLTFKKIYTTKLAQAFAPNVAPEVQNTIEEEISDWFDENEQEIIDADHPGHEQDQALELQKAAKPPVVAGKGPPPKKAQ